MTARRKLVLCFDVLFELFKSFLTIKLKQIHEIIRKGLVYI